MKNLFNFLSKKEDKTMNTMEKQIPTSSEEVKTAKANDVPKVKYIYSTEELNKFLFTSITESLKRLSKTEGYILTSEKKNYNANIDKFSTQRAEMTIRHFDRNGNMINAYLNHVGITEERYKKVIESFSKNSKKRLNKKIIKLAAQPNNPNRLAKLLNYIEFLGSNQISYEIINTKENQITSKRKVYKDIVKHIKMNLPEELKKAKQEYREVKGDFYKNQ